MTAEDLEAEEPAELWPDTAPSFNVFCSLGTQWRTGHAGPSGLDYAGVQAALNLMRVPRPEWPDLFEDLRDLESGALQAIHEK